MATSPSLVRASNRAEMEGLETIGLCTAIVRSHGWTAAQTIWDDILLYEEDDSASEEASERSGGEEQTHPEDEWPEPGFALQTEDIE